MLEVDTALHKGDAGPRSTLCSHHDPVTLFGAAVSKSGWAEVSAAFEWLASRFSNFESARYEGRPPHADAYNPSVKGLFKPPAAAKR